MAGHGAMGPVFLRINSARRGAAGQGLARQGAAGQGMGPWGQSFTIDSARQGAAWPGWARPGLAGRGWARLGRAWGHEARSSRDEPRRGLAWRG